MLLKLPNVRLLLDTPLRWPDKQVYSSLKPGLASACQGLSHVFGIGCLPHMAVSQVSLPFDRAQFSNYLGTRSLVLVGMMGVGKSSVGRRLAQALDLPFVDADKAIEEAANRTIVEIFDAYGEAHFRDGEKRVIQRLLTEGPQVLATGGGAFMSEETRREIAGNGISIWLSAELEILYNRVKRKPTRPLLQQPNPEKVLADLLEVRNPVYALADVTVTSRDVPHETVVSDILEALKHNMPGEPISQDPENGADQAGTTT